MPMRKADGAGVANFIKENIICRFGIPKVMLSDNGTPFVNRHVGRLLDAFQIKHHKSTPYYSQGNGQAEATNKILIRILSILMDKVEGTWFEQLLVALWTYRMSKSKPTQATPFFLVNGSEVMLPVELAVPSARMAMLAHLVPDSRKNDIEVAEERRDRATRTMEKYHQSMACAYNQSVQHKEFNEGDLVWKTVDAIMWRQLIPKFSPRWKGPYKVSEASSNRYYKLTRVDGGFRTGLIYAKYVKEYFP
ncbi:uncharacterized protein LOC114320596 [Camellia sinensis]|uniref:uncharacterized protein LOC114320596 n=1 Tax=Camellia sinensis TaxID=4442 RepID=UPI00103581A2|nr:uncharacterized protein LOC114320596 [Camellia sinensis]